MPTPFQQKVYSLLLQIPPGKVTTYAFLAKKLNIKAYRAIGQALKANKNPEQIPCYKVVKSNGGIGGYLGRDTKNIIQKIKKLEEEGIAIEPNEEIRYSNIKNFNNHLYQF